MNNSYSAILQESIRIELQVADLYLLFHEGFPEDAEFWWQIALEEKNHAALIRSLFEISEQLEDFPEDMFSSSLVELRETNAMLSSMIEEFKSKLPDRETALNSALSIEESAGELHYQGFMEGEDLSHLQINGIFRQLNKEDKDHSVRIRAYMSENSIPVR